MHKATILLLAACGAAAPRPPAGLQALLPKEVHGVRGSFFEDRSGTGILAIYKRDLTTPASHADPDIRIELRAPRPTDREMHLAPGWFEPRADIVNRDYRGHAAQVVIERSACGPTKLGQPIDPSTCTVAVILAIRFANDRSITIRKEPVAGDAEVTAIADSLDLPALETAAQSIAVPAEPR